MSNSFLKTLSYVLNGSVIINNGLHSVLLFPLLRIVLASPSLRLLEISEAITNLVCGDIIDHIQLYQKIINVGKEHAKSNILKLAANYIVSVLVELIGQTYSLAEKSKIDLQLVNELIHMILAYPGLEQYANRIRTRDFDNVGFALSTAFKDVPLILQTSSDVRAPLPFANIIRDKFIAAIANDLDTKDWITTYKITRMLAGLQDM